MFATERDLPVALWIDTPALGDTIAAIPTLRKLSKAFEDKPLTVFTSNPSLFDEHPLVYQALHSDQPKDGYKVYHTFWPLVGKTYDLSGSKVEFRHSNTEIRQFHAMSLGFSLTTEELETDLYCETELDLGIEDYVIIHPTYTWPTRTWEQAKWQELVDRLNANGIPVVAVGKDSAEVGTFSVQKPVMQIEIKLGVNLLNDPRTNIAALRWMMNHKANAVITMDSGILHVAGTTDVNIIQLGSSIDPKLRAPWRKGSQDYKYGYVAGGCNIFCSSNMRYNSRVHGSIHGVPPQIHCLEDKPTFECQPTVDQVFESTLKLTGFKEKRAYVYYGNEAYLETIEASIKALRQFSNLPVYVYALDSDCIVELDDVKTIKWQTRSNGNEIATITNETGNHFIDRKDPNIYTILIERPNIVKHALEYFADSVAYIDADSVAMPWVDRIFDLYKPGAGFPYFTTGIHDYLHIDGRGGALTKEDLSTTLEHEACLLFGVDQKVRETYKQSGYFVADQSCISFLEEWYQMCNHPAILNDFTKYAPYHEETIMNVLLWKKHILFESLPLVYVNGSVEIPKLLSEIKFNGEYQQFGGWLKVPGRLEDIMFIHGEKRPEIMNQITDEIIKHNMRKKRLLYIAPHLSTGGMPQFLQTRVEAMLSADEYEVHVLEYNQYATDYVVQRNRIQGLLGNRFWAIGQLHDIDHSQRGDMMKQIIEKIQPDLIHIEESPEAFDSFNRVEPTVLNWLYDPSHTWKIIETCHNIWFNAANKTYMPDGMMYCTPYHPTDNFKRLEDLNILSDVVPYPLFDHIPTRDQKLTTKQYLGMDPNKIHVLNVGLWTSGKNQAEGVEIARIAEQQFPGKFQFHFVGNQAPNFQEYWGPVMQNLPTNVKVWGERSDTKSFMVACDAFMFNSTWECSPLALREAISHGMVTFSRNLPQYLDTFTPYIVPFSNDLTENASTLIQRLTEAEELFGTFTLPKDDFARFQQQHLHLYGRTLSQLDGPVRPALVPANSGCQVRLDHQGMIRLHIDQVGTGEWSAEFWDESEAELVSKHSELQAGFWYSPARKWHTDWLVKVLHNGKVHTELRWTLKDRECHVQFDTGSLGDTLSWVGQLVNFKQHHGVQKLLVYTPKNWLFDQEWYKEQGIYFVEQRDHNHPCIYTLGVYFDQNEPWKRDEHKYDWRTVTLGKIAADRLGIEYQEARPRLASQFTHGSVKVEKPYVCIATQSTAQAKYWNNPTGWQELTKWYNEQGLDVYHVSKEGIAPAGAIQTPEDLGIVAAYIRGAKHFVGISSGLSWFAWALGKETILISGFTDPYVEFKDKAYYVNNHQVCHGCWGNRVFDRNDWNWCPDWKGTNRQFECSKKISSQQVIKVADALLKRPAPTFIKNR